MNKRYTFPAQVDSTQLLSPESTVSFPTKDTVGLDRPELGRADVLFLFSVSMVTVKFRLRVSDTNLRNSTCIFSGQQLRIKGERPQRQTKQVKDLFLFQISN